MSDLYVKSGGTWKVPTNIYYKQSGSWVPVQAVYRKESGVWVKHWPADFETAWGGTLTQTSFVLTNYSYHGWSDYATNEIPSGVRTASVAHIVGIDLEYDYNYYGGDDDHLDDIQTKLGTRIRYQVEQAMTDRGVTLGSVTEVGPFVAAANAGGGGEANLQVSYTVPADKFLVGLRYRTYRDGGNDDDSLGSNTHQIEFYFRIAGVSTGTLSDLTGVTSTGTDTRTSGSSQGGLVIISHNSPASANVATANTIRNLTLRTYVDHLGSDDDYAIANIQVSRTLGYNKRLLEL